MVINTTIDSIGVRVESNQDSPAIVACQVFEAARSVHVPRVIGDVALADGALAVIALHDSIMIVKSAFISFLRRQFRFWHRFVLLVGFGRLNEPMSFGPHFKVRDGSLDSIDVVIEASKASVTSSAKQSAMQFLSVVAVIYCQVVSFAVSRKGWLFTESAYASLLIHEFVVLGLIDSVLFLFDCKSAVVLVVRLMIPGENLFGVALSTARRFVVSRPALAAKFGRWKRSPATEANLVSKWDRWTFGARFKMLADRSGINQRRLTKATDRWLALLRRLSGSMKLWIIFTLGLMTPKLSRKVSPATVVFARVIDTRHYVLTLFRHSRTARRIASDCVVRQWSASAISSALSDTLNFTGITLVFGSI